MNFYFPTTARSAWRRTRRTRCTTCCTLRGALVRDPLRLVEVPQRGDRPVRGDAPTSLFASHHWPTWGTDRLVEFLAQQRDLYRYLHDQTLRHAQPRADRGRDRRGRSRLPPALASAWAHARLLRHGQPQRQGDLPALPRLVRRQPRPPVGAPAGRGGEAIRRVHGRRRRGARRRPRVVRRRRLPLGRTGAQPRRLRRPGQRRGAASAGRRARATRLPVPRTGPWRTST